MTTQRPITHFPCPYKAASPALWFAALCMAVLVLSACGPKTYPTARPKYGDSTSPIGPDKSHFKPPPKSQPKFQ